MVPNITTINHYHSKRVDRYSNKLSNNSQQGTYLMRDISLTSSKVNSLPEQSHTLKLKEGTP